MNNAERIANDMAARRAAPKMKHTPGPWRAHQCEGIECAWSVKSESRPQWHYICWTRENRDFREESIEADARLIAAAPDLLAALEGMIESYDLAYENSPEIVQDSTLRGYFDIDAARAALAKAKGE